MSQKVAFIFPGQGSQAVGMGKEIYKASDAAKQVFHKAEEIIPGIMDIIFEGPEDKLMATEFCQPAILTVSVACLVAFKDSDKSKNFEAVYAAGHSLGEYSALVACGALDFGSALQLVRKRSECMQKAVNANPGKMAAVIGLNPEMIEDICREVGAEVANYNSLDQIVITGKEEAVDAASKKCEEAGAKRVVPLAVAGAFHSSLMKSAADEFSKTTERIALSQPSFPIISNVEAEPATDIEEIRFNMPKQIYSSVLWVETVQYIQKQGIDTFIEFGNGTILKGLVKKIDKALNVISVGSPEDLK